MCFVRKIVGFLLCVVADDTQSLMIIAIITAKMIPTIIAIITTIIMVQSNQRKMSWTI